MLLRRHSTPWCGLRARARLPVAIAAFLVAIAPFAPFAPFAPSPLLAQASKPIPIWQIGAVLGVAGITMLALDRPAQGWARSDRSGGSDELSNTIKRFGQPEVYATVAGGLIATGLITGDDDVTRAGGRVATSVALAAVSSQALKYTFGRARPHSGDGDEFAPFSRNPSLPSGHTAVAFALAASLSDEIHHPMATIGLYGAATGVAWSRVYQDHHWASDVILGAGLGIVSAKFANGKLTVFGVRAPKVLLGPQSASVSLAF